ncbi:hypothetical protein TMUPMC115_2536 [Tetragenococcus muriaticus PMC-11-5]|uniref:Uncharacterized protein n=1 Tax=Tetragenococcus muriaticus PMC-11-5 TaxID=1302649 RepID=A0A091BXX8_9ENTE|nr:hypothetical protein TMUPMC115_2536 [Tetragenococcus muriaticus PMC-11-5]
MDGYSNDVIDVCKGKFLNHLQAMILYITCFKKGVFSKNLDERL